LDRQRSWRLSLARNGKTPSATEVKTVMRDFGVPEDANKSTDTNGGWEIVRLTWKEARQGPLFEVAPVENKDNYYKTN
jgi:hypothetical protein